MSERVLVIGDGKMGHAVAEVAAERGCTVVGMLGPGEMARGLTAGMADVAIEFTEPAAAAGNVRACAKIALPVVSGTTGWDSEMAAVRDEVVNAGGALLHAPNFALGIQVFKAAVEAAAKRARPQSPGPSPYFNAQLTETHHVQKLDAPSGTAKMLARVAEAALGRELPITSVRIGEVPGTHEVVFDAQYEQIRLVHEVRDRKVFADGAVAAAQWLVGKRGVFTLEDFIKSSSQ